MKRRLLLFALVAVAAISCEKDDAPTPTLSISPTADIAFSATVIESEAKVITVTTNQATWNAVSNQVWCVVTKTDNTFTVTATANTASTPSAEATITVSAGEATPVPINVTQAATAATYPTTAESLKSAVTKVWEFSEAEDYISLEFGEGDSYSLLSKTAFTRVATNIYLKTGTYTVGADLKTFTLSDFGEVKINTLTEEQMEMVITPTGGVAVPVTITKQTIAPPTTYTKRIKVVDMTDADDALLTYTYNAEGKLINTHAKFPDNSEANIPFDYSGNTVVLVIEGGVAFNHPGVVKVSYILNYAGLATSSTWEYATTAGASFTLEFTTYYTYSSSRELISWGQVDKNGKSIAYCSATWENGNITSTYNWDPVQYHPEWSETKKYYYTTDVNKGGYTLPMHIPHIFEANEMVDAVAHPTGIFGVASKNLMSQHADIHDGDFTYTMDADGYAIRTDINYPSAAPADNWYIDMTYETY